MCFCTIPSNGHTSLSTALVTLAPGEEWVRVIHLGLSVCLSGRLIQKLLLAVVSSLRWYCLSCVMLMCVFTVVCSLQWTYFFKLRIWCMYLEYILPLFIIMCVFAVLSSPRWSCHCCGSYWCVGSLDSSSGFPSSSSSCASALVSRLFKFTLSMLFLGAIQVLRKAMI